ncbi:hypothetical protein [Aquiflexum sp.]|uniref:hypothetical protein n=1 Tax=Aquiflexum sp. TaxID=1872584 RepID=UPI003592E941
MADNKLNIGKNGDGCWMTPSFQQAGMTDVWISGNKWGIGVKLIRPKPACIGQV